MIALRDYQLQAIEASGAAYDRGINRQAIEIPTGSGKTVVFASLVRQRGAPALILAHADELIEQAVKKLRMVASDLSIGVVKAERNEVGADVIVASVQTLARPRRLQQLVQPRGTIFASEQRHFQTVVVDEAHHAAANTYRAIIDGVMGPETLLFGVSATLERGDGKGLDDVFDEIVYERDILWMIQKGYLCDIRAVQVMLKADFGELHSRGGDYVRGEVEDMLHAAEAPKHALQAYQEHAAGRKAIVFTPTVDAAYEFAAAFNAGGIATGVVHGELPIDERRATLDRFHTGGLQVVANCAVLTEGFDEPSVNCVLIARPTKSRGLYVQMVGRGTRTFPGKEDLLVIDLVGSTTQHNLVTVASLFGLEPTGKVREKGVLTATNEKTEKEKAQQERLGIDGQLVSKTVDLFRGRDVAWRVGNGVYTLSTGDGMVIVSEAADGWSIDRLEDRELVTIERGLDLGYAQGIAEDLARKAPDWLNKPEASWRKKKPSDKMLNALRGWRIPVEGIETAGEASELLSAAIAKAALSRRRRETRVAV